MGWSVSAFTSAAEILERVPTNGVGCILLDVNMPGMSGPELHERLRELGLNFPVIYLTGQGNVPLSVQAMKRGALDFLEKPIDEDLLLAAIDNVVAQHRAHQAQDQRVADRKSRLAKLSTVAAIVIPGIFTLNPKVHSLQAVLLLLLMAVAVSYVTEPLT